MTWRALSTSPNTTVERVDKHPFCMSRVYYNSKDKDVDVWVAVDNCRWKQSSSEVSVQVLGRAMQVDPRETPVLPRLVSVVEAQI
jgi:hypothetical protein